MKIDARMLPRKDDEGVTAYDVMQQTGESRSAVFGRLDRLVGDGVLVKGKARRNISGVMRWVSVYRPKETK